MPVYAYTCRDCGTPLEVHQEFSDAALTVCPTCGGALRKQYGSIGVTFNGSGFYRTDSRGGAGDQAKPEAKNGGSKQGDAKAEPAKSEPKSESKPAAPTSPASTSPS